MSIDCGGCCFLCLEVIDPRAPNQNKLGSESISISSLECLSRYLKINLAAVLNRKGEIPYYLVANNVKGTRISVTLCEGCISLNDKFSKLFLQLEKAEMEVSSCAALIQRKLVEAEKKKGLCKGVDGFKGQLEVVGVLRKTVIEKCSSILSEHSPRVVVGNLSQQQVQIEKQKLKSSNSITSRYQQPTNFQGAGEEDLSDVEVWSTMKFEIPIEDIDENDPPIELDKRDQGGDPLSTQSKLLISSPDGNTQFEETGRHHWNKSAADMDFSRARDNQKSNAKMGNTLVDNRNTDLRTRSEIEPPLKIFGIAGTHRGQSSLNSKTGKAKCLHCSREFSCLAAFYTHFNNVHLKMRYGCRHCGKEFPNQRAYNNHYWIVHLGLRFKCNQCDKTFLQKDYLRVHHQSVHLGRRYQCRLCYKTFTTPTTKSYHMKNCRFTRKTINTAVKLEGKSNMELSECDICLLKVSDLSTHLYTVHYEPEGGGAVNEDSVATLPTMASKTPDATIADNLGTHRLDNKKTKVSNAEIPPPLKLIGIVGKSRGQCKLSPKTGKYKCSHCPKEFAAQRSFDSHYKSVHLKIRYKCTDCEEEFSYKHRYDIHYMKVHAGVKYKCEICEKTYADKRTLDDHHKTVHASSPAAKELNMWGCP